MCFASAIEIVFSCFVIIELSFLLLKINDIDMEPNKAARPAKGIPAIIPIPLRAAARPLDDKTTAMTTVTVDVVWQMYFSFPCLFLTFL